MDRGRGSVTDGVTRRRLIQGGAGLLGVSAWGGLGAERAVAAKPSWEPRPIPGGFAEDFSLVPVDPLIHVLPPSVGFELSTITDFKGVVGAAEIRGTATDGDVTYDFDADMRFMKGQYITIDGRLHNAAFAFV
jgi:hypothetical protein